MVLSSEYRKGTSHRGVFDRFWGEGQGDDHSGLPASAIFSNSFCLKYSICQVPYLGVVCLNSIIIITVLEERDNISEGILELHGC